MNSLRAFTLLVAGLVAAAPAAAQYAMRTGSLGGSAAAGAFSRPLGGFGPGYNFSGSGRHYRNSRNGGSRGPRYGYPYTYSVWVPDYFDYLNDSSQYAAPYGYAPDASAPHYGNPPPAAPQQPVIINQYFSSPPPATNAPEAAKPEAGSPSSADGTAAPAPGDPIGTPQNYYLIAYKNHEVYAALAYWVEDKTLHYVTTQNTHNQASLDLIDLALTKTLNRRNDVPFSIPGQ